VALGAAGKVLVRKKFTRKQLLTYTANVQTSLIGMEACSGAHFLGRALRKQGHDVRLIAAQFVKPFVKPFVKSNKNDFVDAEAIAEAVERKNMRFVPMPRHYSTGGKAKLLGISKRAMCTCAKSLFMVHEPPCYGSIDPMRALRTE
jgi:transposase